MFFGGFKEFDFGKKAKTLNSLPPAKFDFCVQSKRVKVVDGDTLKLSGKNKAHKIRLIGIDSPEMKQVPFGQQAKETMEQMVHSDDDKLLCCKACAEKYDKYHRELAYCWVGETFINAEMLRRGQAVTLFVGDKNIEYKSLFHSLEDEAENKGLGIYNPEKPLPLTPYAWRQTHRYSKSV